MNKKVEELVERVRLTPDEIRIAIGKFRDSEFRKGKIPELKDYDMAIAQAQLNKVLNDKDLALIDRKLVHCTMCHGKGLYSVSLYGGVVTEDRECPRCGGSGKVEVQSVISLAEALKEVKDEVQEG